MTCLDRAVTLLRGTLAGAVVSGVPLPFLDCFLDANGTALAATGRGLLVVFGIWFQPSLSLNPGRWIPDTVGVGYDSKVELEAATTASRTA